MASPQNPPTSYEHQALESERHNRLLNIKDKDMKPPYTLVHTTLE